MAGGGKAFECGWVTLPTCPASNAHKPDANPQPGWPTCGRGGTKRYMSDPLRQHPITPARRDRDDEQAKDQVDADDHTNLAELFPA